MSTHFMYSYKDDGLNGRELRYSLRSLDTFMVDRDIYITIVGDKPEWLTDVRHVPLPQNGPAGAKVSNIMGNVIAGARVLASEGVMRAVYMDDDFMLLDPSMGVPLTYLKPWDDYIKGVRRLRTEGVEWYVEAALRTDKILSPHPYSLGFENHRPLPFQPAEAVALLENVHRHHNGENGVFWRSVYGNLIGQHLENPTRARDAKVGANWQPGSAWSSSDERAWATVERKLSWWLNKPSRWEKS